MYDLEIVQNLDTVSSKDQAEILFFKITLVYLVKILDYLSLIFVFDFSFLVFEMEDGPPLGVVQGG